MLIVRSSVEARSRLHRARGGYAATMSTNHIVIDAAPEDVWTVLSDAYRYHEWVVGAQTIRDADEDWPRPGTTMHHAVGLPPLVIPDHTDSLESDRPTHLKLRAYVRPFVTSDIVLDLTRVDGGTKLTMVEHTVAGIGGIAPLRWLTDGVFWLRNHEALRRLRNLVKDVQLSRS